MDYEHMTAKSLSFAAQIHIPIHITNNKEDEAFLVHLQEIWEE